MDRDLDREPLSIRAGEPADLPAINAIYNRFVVETPVTFDVDPVSEPERARWFGQFARSGPYRLLVASRDSAVVGFACSKEFRQRKAYETSVETTIYLDLDHVRRGIGLRLYTALFDVLADEDLHRAYAGITLPNTASIALHERCGFHAVGTYDEVGRKFGRYWSVGWYEKALP